MTKTNTETFLMASRGGNRQFVYSVRVMAVLFNLVLQVFKTVVDMFDHRWGGFDFFISIIAFLYIFHDWRERGFHNCTVIHHIITTLQTNYE